MRILIAGVGNVLRCDDGFGIEVLRRLEESLASDGVEYFESGIAGISLVQKLMDDYDALIIIDALDRGAEPGRVFVLEPDAESLKKPPTTHEATDLHQADPEVVLRMAVALKTLPPRTWIVGCQAQDCDDLGAPLTEAVARAVPVAVERIRQIVQSLQKEPACEPAR
ncbi:MAG: hydrogenase maturation protease [Verrucomicrobiota bacterium]|nr:hydrogenase maturation protease [Verrucomicrobiota bacterium]